MILVSDVADIVDSKKYTEYRSALPHYITSKTCIEQAVSISFCFRVKPGKRVILGKGIIQFCFPG